MAVSADLEKRVFQRMIIDKPVTIISENSSYNGVCKDLSANGMSVELDKKLIAVGAQVNINLGASDARVPPLEATAKVVRSTDSEDSSKEILGLEFITVC